MLLIQAGDLQKQLNETQQRVDALEKALNQQLAKVAPQSIKEAVMSQCYLNPSLSSTLSGKLQQLSWRRPKARRYSSHAGEITVKMVSPAVSSV